MQLQGSQKPLDKADCTGKTSLRASTPFQGDASRVGTTQHLVIYTRLGRPCLGFRFRFLPTEDDEDVYIYKALVDIRPDEADEEG